MWGGATLKSQRMQCAGAILQRPKGEKIWCSKAERWTGDSLLPMVSEGRSLLFSLSVAVDCGPVNVRQFVKRSLTSNMARLGGTRGGNSRG